MDKNRLFQLELKCKKYQKSHNIGVSSYFTSLREKLPSLKLQKLKILKFNPVQIFKSKIFIYIVASIALGGSGYFGYQKLKNIDLSEIEFDIPDMNISTEWLEDSWSMLIEAINTKEEFVKESHKIETNLTITTSSDSNETNLTFIEAVEPQEIIEEGNFSTPELEREIDFNDYILLDYKENSFEEMSQNDIVDELEDGPEEKIVYILELYADNRKIIDYWGKYYEKETPDSEKSITEPNKGTIEEESIAYVLEIPPENRKVIDHWGETYERGDRESNQSIREPKNEIIEKKHPIFEVVAKRELIEESRKELKKLREPLIKPPQFLLEGNRTITEDSKRFENKLSKEENSSSPVTNSRFIVEENFVIIEEESQEVVSDEINNSEVLSNIFSVEDSFIIEEESRDVLSDEINKSDSQQNLHSFIEINSSIIDENIDEVIEQSDSNEDSWDGFYIFDENLTPNSRIKEYIEDVIIDELIESELPELNISLDRPAVVEEDFPMDFFDEVEKNKTEPLAPIEMISPTSITVDDDFFVDSEIMNSDNPLEEAISKPYIEPLSQQRVTAQEETALIQTSDDNLSILESWNQFALFEDINTSKVIAKAPKKREEVVIEKNITEPIKVEPLQLKPIESKYVERGKIKKEQIDIDESWGSFNLFEPISKDKITKEFSKIPAGLFKDMVEVDNIQAKSEKIDYSKPTKLPEVETPPQEVEEEIGKTKEEDSNNSLEADNSNVIDSNISTSNETLDRNSSYSEELNSSVETVKVSVKDDTNSTRTEEISREPENLTTEANNPPQPKESFEPDRRSSPNSSVAPADVVEVKVDKPIVEKKDENRYNTIFLKPIINIKDMR